ncbi:hypothetical protein IJ21_28410 [Paenibacillus sp. 32O-W]|nr:hypothetical protein IJ21_28410 [Paenibacillus sp. 32O-W]
MKPRSLEDLAAGFGFLFLLHQTMSLFETEV